MKRKKRRRKDSDIVLPLLPEGVTEEDIARALVGQVTPVKLVANESDKPKKQSEKPRGET